MCVIHICKLWMKAQKGLHLKLDALSKRSSHGGSVGSPSCWDRKLLASVGAMVMKAWDVC